MSTERIQAALRDATDTKDVVIAAGVLTSVGEVFSRTFGDVPAVVVADENTYQAAGEEVHRRLMGAGRTMVDPYVFPGRPALRAEYGNITTLAGWLRTHDAIPVAVASGTAFHRGKRRRDLLPQKLPRFQDRKKHHHS